MNRINVHFKMLSLNVRGLRNYEKRTTIFNWCNDQKADIYFLQETYSTKEVESQWRKQWRGDIFFSHGTNHSKGVTILVRDTLDFEVKNKLLDDNGRYVILDATIQNSPFLLVNIYTPNKVGEQRLFFKLLKEKIQSLDNSENAILLGGDLNIILNPDLDGSGGKLSSKKESVKDFEDLMLTFDLSDIWRLRNPKKKTFTWRQKKPVIQRRLDYWIISDFLQEEVEVVDIITPVKTDHSAVTIEINSISSSKRGSSFWKMNNSHLQNDDYANMIKSSFSNWLDDVKDTKDPRIKWDWIKYKIRQETIVYSKNKAKERRKKLKLIEGRLKEAESRHDTIGNNESLEELEQVKGEYEAEYDYITQGTIIRSRVNWHEKGEKNNKFFLNLESNRKKKTVIRKLSLNKKTITDPTIIMQEIQAFYENLYEDKTLAGGRDPSSSSFPSGNIPKLSEEMKRSCEGELSVNECLETLKTFSDNKSPGNDGISAEFYKTFWPLVGKILVESLNHSYKHGELSTSQRQAVITLIEKKDKDRCLIKNWRPISLINVDAKIGSKTIARRLEKVLPAIIHHNQHAFVHGRTIFDAVRTIDDVLDYTKTKHIDALLVTIDFEKAFDSVNWDFLNKTLREFNFGPSLISWVETFYNNISSCVMNNGVASPFFKISRGVRQGDPLSPYLFIMVLETLLSHIRYNNHIEGLLIRQEEIKMVTFADDLTVFLRNIESFHKLSDILNEFYIHSGLKINDDKTEFFCLGSAKMSSKDLQVKEIKKKVRILGVFFSYDNLLFKKLNYESMINKLKSLFRSWKWRGLTIMGKIQVIKSFAIPKILFCTSLSFS
ncbi:MAG: hypothetical protein DSY43_00385 [Gammaproteobacteria bacterium]|nr:MAG: hypothetical protein DSY43_00385 [Gammaproteobacteria bacterium]